MNSLHEEFIECQLWTKLFKMKLSGMKHLSMLEVLMIPQEQMILHTIEGMYYGDLFLNLRELMLHLN